MDCYTMLGLPRTVWIDAERLKQEFLTRSSQVHPDKAATPGERIEAEKAFTDLNRAHQTLRNTRSRILHLLELEGAPAPAHVQQAPAEVMSYFGPVGEVTRRADALLKEKSAAHSPMLKVQFFEKALEYTDDIQRVQATIRAGIDEIENELRRDEQAYQAPLSPQARMRLERAAAILGFLERWQNQLQERATALTF